MSLCLRARFLPPRPSSLLLAIDRARDRREADALPIRRPSVVDQHTLLKQVPRIEGRIDLPDQREPPC